MKMSQEINKEMFAPCGVNCEICSAYLRSNNPCSGCLTDDDSKPLHCLNCAKKKCVKEKGISHCYKCEEFPCSKILVMDKKYRDKYGVSTIGNGKYVDKKGVTKFLEVQKLKYTCQKCSGIIDVHNKRCSECGENAELLSPVKVSVKNKKFKSNNFKQNGFKQNNFKPKKNKRKDKQK